MKNMKNNCMLLSEQSSFLFRSSFMMLLSVGYSYYRGYYDFTISTMMVQIASIVYWHKPEYNWKRNLDMFIAIGSIVYHCIRAYKSECHVQFYSFTTLGTICYFTSWKVYKQNKIWSSVYLHSSVHLLYNIAILSLYSGDIVPICDNTIISSLVTPIQLCN